MFAEKSGTSPVEPFSDTDYRIALSSSQIVCYIRCHTKQCGSFI